MSDYKKQWIDAASYEELLRKWRFEPSGSDWFAGDVGAYFVAAMKRKREEIGHDAAVQASKSIGWE